MIEMRNITKTFSKGRVVANEAVNFSVERGEIHALLGENGAGKTTLMNVLYGLYQPDEGEIVIDGKPVVLRSPTDAMALEIGMIHQHFKLVEAFTVAENVAIGLGNVGKLRLDRKRVARELAKMSTEYKLAVDPEEYVENLSVGRKQRVEIIKAFYRGARILIMDEPTAVLTPSEVEELFDILRNFRATGGTVIYISHKLSEIMEIADRVTVMRQGKQIGVYDTADVTADRLAELMVGRAVFLQYDREAHQPCEKPVLALDAVCVDTGKRATSLKNISLRVEKGEILGIAGVDGNGQETLERAISGMNPPDAGSIQFHEKDITAASIRERIDLGVGYLTSDRMVSALVQDFSIKYNLILKSFGEAPYTTGGILRKNVIDEAAEQMCADYLVKKDNINEPVSNLSGGNQQKIALAREIQRDPELLIISQPTRGVDIGAMEFLHKKIIEKSRGGMAVILVSSNLDEVLELSDRILVMYEGEVLGEFKRGDIDLAKIGAMMAGVKAS